MTKSVSGKISVIIPTYNTDTDTLERCIISILNQESCDIEIIVIVDGGDIPESLTFRFKDRPVLIKQISHSGVSAARNIGLSLANGEYVCFCDADDELLPSALKNMINAFDANVDLVIGAVVKRYSPLIKDEETIGKIEAIHRLFLHNAKRILGTVWGKMFRSDVIFNHNPISFDEDIYVGEDALFVLYYLERCSQIKLIPDYIYKHYYNSNGIILTRGQQENLSSLDACDKMIAFLIKKKLHCVDVALEDLTWVYNKVTTDTGPYKLKEEIYKKYTVIKNKYDFL